MSALRRFLPTAALFFNLSFLSLPPVVAGPGDLDTTFSADGKVTTPVGLNNDAGRSVALQDDGKIIVAGLAGTILNSDFAIARYNSDGALDTSFVGDAWLPLISMAPAIRYTV